MDYTSDALVLELASEETIKKMIHADPDSNDAGNNAVTKLSLLFLSLHLYSVNANSVPRKTRTILHYVSLLWFTSFHTNGSTMMANK